MSKVSQSCERPSRTTTSRRAGETTMRWPWVPEAKNESAGMPPRTRSRPNSLSPRFVKKPAPYPSREPGVGEAEKSTQPSGRIRRPPAAPSLA